MLQSQSRSAKVLSTLYNILTFPILTSYCSATEDAAAIAVKKTKTPKPVLEDLPKATPVKKDAAVDISDEKIAGSGDSSKASKSSKVAKATAKVVKTAKAVKAKETKQSKPADPTSDAEDDNEEDARVEDDESEIDDQTEALLKGFESDGDNEDADNDGGLKEGEDVPEAPISKRSKKQLQKASDFPKDDNPGVVYVGRIPHGFYEHEMREYFKQFGTILKLRMSRNRRTGASRHVAWIEFESAIVAEIVAKTMDNYLLFGHILKVKVIPDGASFCKFVEGIQ